MKKNSYSKFKYLKILVCSILISSSSSLFALTDKEKENKKIVTEFYNMAFKDHKPLEAANLYIGDQYKQHNPHVPDGKKAKRKIQYARSGAVEGRENRADWSEATAQRWTDA